jgi:hypothetical protein
VFDNADQLNIASKKRNERIVTVRCECAAGCKFDRKSRIMNRRSISWVGSISDELGDQGPVSFARRRLKKQEHLFANRSAFFYTPTENIPADFIGSGPLDVTLPVATPDWTDAMESRAYLCPRFWVDLIQRQTGKLRWHPISRAQVIFVRCDCFLIGSDHLAADIKGVLDALKVRTSGRRDRIYLHYFGAIVDDSPDFVDVSWEQELVEHPKDAKVRVQVLPTDSLTQGGVIAK